MLGKIRTYQKCQKCGKDFIVLDNEKGIACLNCMTVPSRLLYIDARDFGIKPPRLYTSRKGKVFTSFDLALQQLEAMRESWGVDGKSFNADDWIARKVAEFKFELLIEGLLKKYERQVETGQKSRAYVRKVRQRVRDYLTPFFKGMDIRDIARKKKVVEFYYTLLDRSLSDKTIKHILSILHTFLMDNDDLIMRVPRFPEFKVIPKRQKKWMGQGMQLLVLSYVRDKDRLSIELAIDTGLRTGEISALKKKDLLFMDGYLTVCAAFSENEFRETTKEGYHCYKPKIVGVSQPVWQKLIEHVKDLREDEFIFTREGKPYVKDRLYRVWRSACKKAKVPHVPISNATRHSRASQIMEKHLIAGREEARQQLGHSTSLTTERNYILNKMDEVRK